MAVKLDGWVLHSDGGFEREEYRVSRWVGYGMTLPFVARFPDGKTKSYKTLDGAIRAVNRLIDKAKEKTNG